MNCNTTHYRANSSSVPGDPTGESVRNARLAVDATGRRVAVTVRADKVAAATKALARVGFVATASRPDLHFVEGTLPIASLRSVAGATKGVGRVAVRPSYDPITATGSVNGQADFVLEADRVRATVPVSFTGAGQKVGVISDSYNRLGGAATGIASGDLPAAGVTVVEEAASGGTDEGRAMLELVHDLAPGAALGFATGNGGEQAFADNIRDLANPAVFGAGVIVDDVVYFAEPMFQDGVVAQAINEVVATRGVGYFAAAGNEARRAYESTTFQTAADTITIPGAGTRSGTFYDFNPAAGGVDTRQRITIPAGGRVVLSFQWDDPWYTAGGVDTDLDLFLIDPTTNLVVAAADANNLAAQDPAEVLAFMNATGAAKSYDVAIQKAAGPNSGRIKYVNYGTDFTFVDAYAGANAPALVPHAGAAGGQGVGAVPYYAQHLPETFTSQGPQTVLFSPTGSPVAAQVRNAPQVAGADGADTTFFGGGDFDNNARPNFFGTSAAAAHVAAVAALVRQANPSFTPAQLYARLQATADDVGAPGFDASTGAGLVNAFDAVHPAVAPAPLGFADGFESGVLPASYETRSTGSGRIQVTAANGPFAGTRHLTLESPITVNPDPVTGSGNQFSLNEVTLHVDASGAGTKTLSFRQREYGDEDHDLPATFTNSFNGDGVSVSVDGVNWFRVVSLVTSTGASTEVYAPHTYNLTAIAAAAGITLSSDTRIRFQQYDDFRIAPSGSRDGMAFDDVAVTGVVASATPGAPDLLAVTDTGSNSGDNLTARDNSSAAKSLQFSVTGTVSGATVSIYAGGVLIGSAVAAGPTTAVTTSGTVDLADGVRAITARQTEAGKGESAASPALNVTIDTAAPAVAAVFVAGGAWQPGFLSYLQATGAGDAAYGYRLTAAAHADELPWTNLDRFSVRFSEDVAVTADDLVVRGVNVAAYGVGAFAYDPATFTATWTLATSVAGPDKLLLDLDADAGPGVADLAGTPLDGEWTNPAGSPATPGGADAFPSGDGAPGGDFRFRVNVLPGDVNRSGGTVNAADLLEVRTRQGTGTAAPGTPPNPYAASHDVDGSGAVDSGDVLLVRNRQSAALPAGEPTAPAPLAAFPAPTQTAMPMPETPNLAIGLVGGKKRVIESVL